MKALENIDYHIAIPTAVVLSFITSALYSVVIGVIVGLLINYIKQGISWLYGRIVKKDKQ